MNARHLQLQRGDLPVGFRYSCGQLLPSETTRFPEDRTHQDRLNKQELQQKASSGQLRRRTQVHIPALDETLEVEFTV